MSFDTVPSLAVDLLALVLGLVVGSFLNVLALRSLSDESVLWPPSKCPRCQHPLSPLDNIPLLSYLLLRGKCRYCRGDISWQYPAVEAFTGLTFVAIERVVFDPMHSIFYSTYWNTLLFSFLSDQRKAEFTSRLPSNLSSLDDAIAQQLSQMPIVIPHWQQIGLLVGMMLLACTLIAVTVTDFREKLIPHEITYPSMIAGILFSAFVRQDFLGAMVGIGASYILFDFIAFYGLKVYAAMHGGMEAPIIRRRRLRRLLTPRKRRRLHPRLRWRLDLATIEHLADDEEQLEVMGGGDAVLSAVMSAYLGWQLLAVALVIGFFLGTLMGMALLVREMAKANLLHKAARSSAISVLGGATAFGLFGLFCDQVLLQGKSHTALPLSILGAVGGLFLGVVSAGTHVSKPYPFGPALAAGGLIAMFLLPNWLSLH